ncbi:MAG: hypothetical protein OXH75_24085 [Acidobacteria bacterium]|nr:hypothetical protein [Acidobacteriota bacterium]
MLYVDRRRFTSHGRAVLHRSESVEAARRVDDARRLARRHWAEPGELRSIAEAGLKPIEAVQEALEALHARHPEP